LYSARDWIGKKAISIITLKYSVNIQAIS